MPTRLQAALSPSPLLTTARARRLHTLVALLSATLQIMSSQDVEGMMVQTRRDLSMMLYPKGCTGQWRGVPHYLNTVPACRVRTVAELRQVFNQINARKLHGQQGVCSGIMDNNYFVVISAIELLLQVLIVQVLCSHTPCSCPCMHTH